MPRSRSPAIDAGAHQHGDERREQQAEVHQRRGGPAERLERESGRAVQSRAPSRRARARRAPRRSRSASGCRWRPVSSLRTTVRDRARARHRRHAARRPGHAGAGASRRRRDDAAVVEDDAPMSGTPAAPGPRAWTPGRCGRPRPRGPQPLRRATAGSRRRGWRSARRARGCAGLVSRASAKPEPLSHAAGELADRRDVACCRAGRLLEQDGAALARRTPDVRHTSRIVSPTVRSRWRPPLWGMYPIRDRTAASVASAGRARRPDVAVEVGDAQQAAEQRGLAGAVRRRAAG